MQITGKWFPELCLTCREGVPVNNGSKCSAEGLMANCIIGDEEGCFKCAKGYTFDSGREACVKTTIPGCLWQFSKKNSSWVPGRTTYDDPICNKCDVESGYYHPKSKEACVKA